MLIISLVEILIEFVLPITLLRLLEHPIHWNHLVKVLLLFGNVSTIILGLTILLHIWLNVFHLVIVRCIVSEISRY
jgi:hypothetical protein